MSSNLLYTAKSLEEAIEQHPDAALHFLKKEIYEDNY